MSNLKRMNRNWQQSKFNFCSLGTLMLRRRKTKRRRRSSHASLISKNWKKTKFWFISCKNTKNNIRNGLKIVRNHLSSKLNPKKKMIEILIPKRYQFSLWYFIFNCFVLLFFLRYYIFISLFISKNWIMNQAHWAFHPWIIVIFWSRRLGILQNNWIYILLYFSFASLRVNI